MQPRRSLRVIVAGSAVVLATVTLAACTGAPTPVDPSTGPTPSMSASSTPTPTTPPVPTLRPEGSATENLPYFTLVTQQVWAGGERLAGRAYIDALTAAGFDKSAMQVTKDQTTLNNTADSIQFSVAWKDECLIGQAGPALTEPVIVVLPILEGGTCLIGDTRPIDW